MSSTYHYQVFHVVFSTRNRTPFIHSAWRDNLWAYLGGIARRQKVIALAVGGTADHAHLLIRLRPAHTMSKVIGRIKSGSSEWIHRTHHLPSFAWQEGYGVFTIDRQGQPALIRYIQNQETHHRHMTFLAEYERFLQDYELPYEERYL